MSLFAIRSAIEAAESRDHWPHPVDAPVDSAPDAVGTSKSTVIPRKFQTNQPVPVDTGVVCPIPTGGGLGLGQHEIFDPAAIVELVRTDSVSAANHRDNPAWVAWRHRR